MVIHDPPLVFHFEPCCAVAEIVDADVTAFIGQQVAGLSQVPLPLAGPGGVPLPERFGGPGGTDATAAGSAAGGRCRG